MLDITRNRDRRCSLPVDGLPVTLGSGRLDADDSRSEGPGTSGVAVMMVGRVRKLFPIHSFEELGALHRLRRIGTFDRVDRQLRLAARGRVILFRRLLLSGASVWSVMSWRSKRAVSSVTRRGTETAPKSHL